MSKAVTTQTEKSKAIVGNVNFEDFFEGTEKVDVGGDFWNKEGLEGVEQRAVVTGFEEYETTKTDNRGKERKEMQDVCRITLPTGDSVLIGDQAFVSQAKRISAKVQSPMFPIFFTYLGLVPSEKTGFGYHNYKIQLAVKK